MEFGQPCNEVAGAVPAILNSEESSAPALDLAVMVACGEISVDDFRLNIPGEPGGINPGDIFL